MSGNLAVSQSLKLSYTPYVDGSPAVNEKVLGPGTYAATLSPRGDRELILKVKAGSNLYVPFELPSSVKLPKDSGEFQTSATNGSGNYEISGKVVTLEEASPEVHHGFESCPADPYPGPCYGDPLGVDCDYPGPMEGEQAVTYRVVTAHKTMSLDIANTGSSGAVATFSADKTSMYRDYLYRGPCY